MDTDLGDLNFFRILNILSIDVIIGSVLSGLFVVKIMNVDPGWSWWIVLPLSVWVLYTTDHILDAKRSNTADRSTSQCFHLVFMKPLLVILSLVVVFILIIVIFYLKKEIIIVGLYILILSGLYLLSVYFFRNKKSHLLQKEVLVSALYTTGIWCGPLSIANTFDFSRIVLMSVFFLAVLVDILVLSFYELQDDEFINPNTFPLKYGQKFTTYTIYSLCFASFALSIYMIIVIPYGQVSIGFKLVMLMIFVILLLFSLRIYLYKNHYYRYLGELVFWIPGLMFFY